MTSGTVVIAGAELTGMTDDQRTRLRRDHIGFVFQAFNLGPTLTMVENITLPVRIAGRTPTRRCWTRWSTRSGWRTGWTTRRRSCPAAAAARGVRPSPGLQPGGR